MIEEAKTSVGKRELEVEEAFRLMLVELTKGKAAGDSLCAFTPERLLTNELGIFE